MCRASELELKLIGAENDTPEHCTFKQDIERNGEARTIRNWQEHDLHMDFSGLAVEGHGQPSDIDLFYMGRDRTLIIGEIKHRRGFLKEGQRRLFENLSNNYKYDAICLFITHEQDVYSGATEVDVSQCKVEEYYYHGRWRTPKKYTTVKEVIDYFSVQQIF